LLKEKPLEQLNTYAPEVSRIVLSKEYLINSFDNEQTILTSINVVKNRFNSLGINGFKGKSKKEILVDDITQQELFEIILKEIEEESKINSKVLEKSLKIVMTKLLGEESFDVYIFSQLLFYQVVYQLLINELYETLKDSYVELSYSQISEMVTSLTDNIMNTNVYSKINEFVERKIAFNDLLEIIINATNNAEFGEF
jgi:hypothetical protein